MSAENNLSYPKIGPFRHWLGKFIFALFGWQTEGQFPPDPKSVVIFAPHTSNWDFVFMLSAAYALEIDPNWMGKKEIFFWPVKKLFHWLGGIPVDRSAKRNTVEQTVAAIKARDQVILGLAPEGTRGQAAYWRTGFYHIAHQAGIPIHLAYINYQKRTAGIKSGFIPSGDMQADMQQVVEFYRGRFEYSKNPENAVEIQVKKPAASYGVSSKENR